MPVTKAAASTRRLLVQLTLDVAQGLEFESIERDAQGAQLLVRELLSRAVASEIGIAVSKSEPIVPIGQRVRTKRG